MATEPVRIRWAAAAGGAEQTHPVGRAGARAAPVAGVLSVLVQLYGLYRPAAPPSPVWFPYADTVQHGVGFALPVLVVLAALRLTGRAGARTELLVTGVFAAHAVVSEIVQDRLLPSRTGDPTDVLADLVGVLVGRTGFRLATSRRR